MSRITSYSRSPLVALPLLAGIVLAAPAAEARSGFGVTVPLVVPPPVMVAPPVVVAPPPVVVAPPPVVVAPPAVAGPPGYGDFWYDRFGRRHWAH